MGAGRAAAQSTAWHAYAAGDPKAGELFAMLSEKEREEIREWSIPTTLHYDDHALEWKDFEHEVKMALDGDGNALRVVSLDEDGPHGDVLLVPHWRGFGVGVSIDASLVITGSADACTVIEVKDFGKLAIVVDIKRSAYTASEGAASLQLAKYGFGAVARYNARGYLPVIWVAQENRWEFGTLVDMQSFDSATIWNRVVLAATRDDDEYATGAHCSGCWSRTRCPAHMVQLNQDALVVPGTTQEALDHNQALQLALDLKRHKDACDKADEYLKAWEKQNGPIRDGKGKKLTHVYAKGRESSFGAARLREAMGAEAEKYIQRGNPTESFRWVNDK